MNFILFDDHARNSLLPFTHTRPVADIRCGIYTMRERWEALLEQSTSTLTLPYLQPVFPLITTNSNVWINAAYFATDELITAISNLRPGSYLSAGDMIIAVSSNEAVASFEALVSLTTAFQAVPYQTPIKKLIKQTDIFSLNEQAIKDDLTIIMKDSVSAPIPEGVTVSGREDLFLEPTARIGAGTIINATGGAVYIGHNAEVMEGCLIRGPFAICDSAVLKMGAKVYSGCTIGPGCKVGGEISNAVFFANSNKGHDGFLGNAVIGEWCNLGADTNSSNLKNNYDEVKIWDEHQHKSVRTGLTFCGLLMGDHSKCGINTMFNTGTVVGVSCNIYGGNFPEKFVPSFAWGGSEGVVTYKLERALDTANRMMDRRHKELSEAEITMYQHIFEQTQKQRDLMFGNK